MSDIIYLVALILLGISSIFVALDSSDKFKFKVNNKVIKCIFYFTWLICFFILEIESIVTFFT